MRCKVMSKIKSETFGPIVILIVIAVLFVYGLLSHTYIKGVSEPRVVKTNIVYVNNIKDVQGEIYNDSRRDIDWVRLEIVCKDNNQVVYKSDSYYVSSVKAKGITPFRFKIDNSKKFDKVEVRVISCYAE
jgi:hypothetical protein